MSRKALHPDTLISHCGLFKGAVLKNIEKLMAEVYPFQNDRAMTVGDLARISNEQILSALRKPGIRQETRDSVLFSIEKARKFAEPIGIRFPIRPELMDGYKDDSEFENRSGRTYGMLFTREQLRHLERLLKKSGDPVSQEILEGEAKLFEEACKDGSAMIDQGRPVLDWEEGENGYELRIEKNYSPYSSPTISVIRRWDTTIQGILVSIVRVLPRPGVGAYSVLVNTDSEPERILWDDRTFKEAEDALIRKLNLRTTSLVSPDPALNDSSDSHRDS